METDHLKQLQKVLRNVQDITGIQVVVFSLLNESSAEFEVKIIEGISISRIQHAKKTIQRLLPDFNPINFSFSNYINDYLKKVTEEKSFVTANLLNAIEDFFQKEAVNEIFELTSEYEVTTFPIIIDEYVKGLISYANKNKLTSQNLKALKAFTSHIALFVENILLNEKLILEVREKTLSLEKEKNNLENNVRERTLKLDNSRSALLYMLKDIDKASKKLSSAKEYTDNIIRSMIETLIVVDKDSIIQTANKATLDLLGYEESEIIGNHLSYIFPGNDPIAVDKLIADLIEKDFISNVEKVYITKDGIEIPVIFSGSVMKEADDTIQGIVCVASDITIRKKHEREVQEQNRKIEKANEELTIALRKAEESDKLKTAFLQNMSHEIRTPLNGIVGFSQLLSSKNYPEANKLEIAKLVERSSYRLIELVNNILDIAKIETGQVTLNNTAFMLNGFMKEVHDFFILFAQEKNLVLSYQNSLNNEDSVIFLDKEKLHQVMVNLINNAIKFTKKGEVSFGYVIKQDTIEFFVKDTGVGIPEDLQEKVFDRFIQADVALTRNYEGSGLGLSICKGLTELMGGKMWLNSEMNKTTTFFFTVPYFPAEIRSDNNQLSEIDLEKLPKKLKILVAEDDDINFKFVNYLFLNSKHTLVRALNGQEAVDLVKHRKDFDIVLMDLKMPVMSGYEATQIIKSKFPTLPIIALTAYAFEDDRKKAKQVGCDDFIQKAYKKETLFEKIIALIKV